MPIRPFTRYLKFDHQSHDGVLRFDRRDDVVLSPDVPVSHPSQRPSANHLTHDVEDRPFAGQIEAMPSRLGAHVTESSRARRRDLSETDRRSPHAVSAGCDSHDHRPPTTGTDLREHRVAADEKDRPRSLCDAQMTPL